MFKGLMGLLMGRRGELSPAEEAVAAARAKEAEPQMSDAPQTEEASSAEDAPRLAGEALASEALARESAAETQTATQTAPIEAETVDAEPTAAVELSAEPIASPLAAKPQAGEQDASEPVATDGALEPLPLIWRNQAAQKTFDAALPPLLIAALTGRPVKLASFKSKAERLLAADVAPPRLQRGVIHAWGVSVPGLRQAGDGPAGFVAPEETEFQIASVRGPESAAAFAAAGVATPDVMGDPLWLAPRLFDLSGVEKTVEIGFLRRPRDGDEPHPHDEIPAEFQSAVKIIDLACEPTREAWTAKAREIAACKRILCEAPAMSAFIEALGVPNAALVQGGGGGLPVSFELPWIECPGDLKDIYAGLGAEGLLAFRNRGREPIDWEAAIDAIDAHWSPVSFDPTLLLASAPFDIVVSLEDATWECPASLEAAQPVEPAAETREEVSA
ncbi:MAG: hypothetical protein AAFW46_04475 [Pseudomonadota bacterium]